MKRNQIELICGCMFSGKTNELIRRVASLPKSTDVLCFKPAIDCRYSPDNIVSHDGQVLKAQAVEFAGAVLDRRGAADVVGIDEIHFLDESVVDVCEQLSDFGVRVICTSLDRDMWGDPFAHIHQLSYLAQTTITYATCKKCGRRANRTHRTIPLLDDNLVGGPEAFEPRCEACFAPPSTPKPKAHTPGLAQ